MITLVIATATTAARATVSSPSISSQSNRTAQQTDKQPYRYKIHDIRV